MEGGEGRDPKNQSRKIINLFNSCPHYSPEHNVEVLSGVVWNIYLVDNVVLRHSGEWGTQCEALPGIDLAHWEEKTKFDIKNKSRKIIILLHNTFQLNSTKKGLPLKVSNLSVKEILYWSFIFYKEFNKNIISQLKF